MMPWPGLVEPLTECLGLGLAGALAAWQLLGVSVLLFLLVHTSFWLLCDMMLIRIIQVCVHECSDTIVDVDQNHPGMCTRV